jgi:hypothetical protein
LRALAIVVVGSGCADEPRTDGAGFVDPSEGDDDGIGEPDDDDAPDDGDSSDEGSAEEDGDSGGPLLDVGNQVDPDGDGCECAPKSDLVYVLAWDGVAAGGLWTFDPATLQFDEIGEIPCNPGAQVFSMGVARDAKAWVQYQPGGDIFTFDVNTRECNDPGYLPGQSGFSRFGMAFVSYSETSECDELYGLRMAGTTPTECPGQACGTLGVIDPQTMSLQVINGTQYSGGELTGTGDGRLYAFVGLSPAKLVEFDKSTGEVVDAIELDGLELTDAFAFAFWGGDFWFFTEAANSVPGLPEGTSKVVKLDYDDSDGQGRVLTNVVPNAPILVAGAGVSTCAPLEPVG